MPENKKNQGIAKTSRGEPVIMGYLGFRVIDADMFAGLVGYIAPNYKRPLMLALMELSEPYNKDNITTKEDAQDGP